mmetsp:Transcript_90025/g.179011  ORF Transcript_90025/g.179011 Transcript_90025/m.179011 type:complete len:432 (+) Transcript_90025:39-1334(+)
MDLREAPYLRSGGQTLVTPREDMSVADMEQALTQRPMRRMQERVRHVSAPQTARGLLEENKQLIQEKLERKGLEKKHSREYFDRMAQENRTIMDRDKAKTMSRRSEHQQLAQHYKSKMAEKERLKANEYNSKLQDGVQIQFFPFVEGDNINRNRETQNQQMREEMRSFLQTQRDKRPPRTDMLMVETSNENAIKYPEMPFQRSIGSSLPRRGDSSATQPDASTGPGDAVAPHMSRHPRFLSRARDHMSRQLHDNHIRKVLDDKVQATRAELEAQAQKNQDDLRDWHEGLLVHDALRYDNGRARAAENRRVQDVLRNQMKESEDRRKREHQDIYGTVGYFGPEEKEVQPQDMHTELCSDLIQQMQVNQQRRSYDRDQKLRQEKRLIDNGIAEMAQDRHVQRHKAKQHKDVLTATWNSQQKIKSANKAVESIA